MIDEKGFVHLHVHSDYSLYDGFQKVEKIAETVSKLGMKAVALTDHGKVAGLIKFYNACKKEGIKPILGLEAYVCDDLNDKKSKRNHLILLAKNNVGYKNLLKISTESHKYIVKIFNQEVPRVDFDILKKYSEGLIVLSGCIASEYSRLVLDDEIEEAKNLVRKYKEVWGDDYYLEVMWTKYNPQLKQIKHTICIAEELGVKIVATNDCHYSVKEDAKYQMAKIAISRSAPYYDENEPSEYYLKSYEEMAQIFKGDKLQYLHNTLEVADKCNVNIVFGEAKLPYFDVPKDNEDFNRLKEKSYGRNEEQVYLRYLAEKGLKDIGFSENKEYVDRLNKELETIMFTGFDRYFLIVSEYTKWARENNIKIGVGRGCFGPENKVKIENGEKKISEITVGDRVLSHDREYHEVKIRNEYDVNEEMIKIEMYDGRIIFCTKDHKILIDKNNEKTWIEAQFLTEEDNIVDLN